MRLIYTLFTLAAGGYGLFWLADKNPELKQKAEELIDFRTTTALEMRYNVDQIMETHQRRLLKEKGARFLDPELKFYPYLLLEVKYSTLGKTKEGHILWDLTAGEMIRDVRTWEKTHGFADCILNNAQSHEFRILHLLSDSDTPCSESTIAKRLDLEPAFTEAMLRSCVKKNLIISNGGNKYRLHLENPHLTSVPATALNGQLTTRPHKRALRAKGHFSKSQVIRASRMAFGESFSVRTSNEVYLPVHRIVVQSPEGMIQTYHFNALNGEELPPAPFYQ